MKITVQEKIAELESRIAALEKAVKSHSRITQEFTSFNGDSVARGHWDRMWVEFRKLMKVFDGD